MKLIIGLFPLLYIFDVFAKDINYLDFYHSLDNFCRLDTRLNENAINRDCKKLAPLITFQATGQLDKMSIACEMYKTIYNCQKYNSEFLSLNLLPIRCASESICADINAINESKMEASLDCAVAFPKEIKKIVISLVDMPKAIFNVIDESFKSDVACFEDSEKKMALVEHFNKFAPIQFQVGKNYIQRMGDKIEGPMTQWPCGEIKKLIRSKADALHDYLANPKNLDKSGIDYFKSSGGLLEKLAIDQNEKMHCLHPLQNAKRICMELNKLAANIAVGFGGNVVLKQLVKPHFEIAPMIPLVEKKYTVESYHVYENEVPGTDLLGNVINKKVKTLSFYLRLNNGSAVNIVMPKNLKWYLSEKQSVDYVKRIIDQLPLDTLEKNPRLKFVSGRNNYQGSYTIGSGQIVVYQDMNKNMAQIVDTFRHEIGHYEGNLRPGSYNEAYPFSYADLKIKDGNSVSPYGDSKIVEDYAEGVKVYLKSDGGTKNPDLLKRFANRFSEFDSIYKITPEKRKEHFDKVKRALEARGIYYIKIDEGTGLFVMGDTIIIDSNDDEIKH